MKRIFAIAFLAFEAVGCGAPLTKDSAPPRVSEGYYVFGVSPADFKVQVYPGSVGADGKFHLNQWLSATFNSIPDQGYAVGKAPAGSMIAITRVYDQSQKSILKTPFVPCADAQTLVFEIVGGKVVYLTDLQYSPDGKGVSVYYKSDVEAARSYMKANFASIEPLMAQGTFRFLKTDIPCTTTITIPIYVPK